jgi:hypothetical protein
MTVTCSAQTAEIRGRHVAACRRGSTKRSYRSRWAGQVGQTLAGRRGRRWDLHEERFRDVPVWMQMSRVERRFEAVVHPIRLTLY